MLDCRYLIVDHSKLLILQNMQTTIINVFIVTIYSNPSEGI